MTDKKLAIKFNLDTLVNKKGELVLTSKVEAEIVKLIQTKKAIDTLLEAIQDNIAYAMEESNTNLIEKENIKITRSITGKRFAFDPAKPIDARFTKEISYPGVNAQEVEKYLTEKGELPEGILENARKQKVNITLLEEEEVN